MVITGSKISDLVHVVKQSTEQLLWRQETTSKSSKPAGQINVSLFKFNSAMLLKILLARAGNLDKESVFAVYEF